MKVPFPHSAFLTPGWDSWYCWAWGGVQTAAGPFLVSWHREMGDSWLLPPHGLHWHFGVVFHCLILSYTSWILCSVFPLSFILLFQLSYCFINFQWLIFSFMILSMTCASTGDLSDTSITAESGSDDCFLPRLSSWHLIYLIIFCWKLDKLHSTIHTLDLLFFYFLCLEMSKPLLLLGL